MVEKTNKVLTISVVALFALSSMALFSACSANNNTNLKNGKTTEELVTEYHQREDKIDKTIATALTPEEKEAYDLIVQGQYDWHPYDDVREFLCGWTWEVAYIVGNGDSDFLEVTENTPDPPKTMLFFERTGHARGTGRDETPTMGWWLPCDGGKKIKYVDNSGKVTEFTISGEFLVAQSDDETKTYTFTAHKDYMGTSAGGQ